jgi:hypothetical protein
MLTVIDNALSETANKIAVDQFKGQSKSITWIDGNLENFLKYKSALSECLEYAAKYFNLNSMIGMELWSHNGTKPDWHYDKDENLFNKTGEIKNPICSIVYYPLIENLIGGHFITETISIKPVTNRLIAFGPMLHHSVEEYAGTR